MSGLVPSGRVSGFTLLECLMAVALIALAVSLTAPSWGDAWAKARRLEASSALWRLQQLQEQHRWRTGAYAAQAQTLLGSSQPTQGQAPLFTLEVAQTSAHGYTLVARSRAGGNSPQDVSCHALALRQYRGEFSRGSACASCDVQPWSAGDGARLTDTARCWGN
jgi:prepilin-type N-terminal cleavage/methylation domain-containing protein